MISYGRLGTCRFACLLSLAWLLPGGASAQVRPAPEAAAPEDVTIGAERPLPPQATEVLDAGSSLGPIELDGVLDEPDWARGRVFSGFTQGQPVEGDPADQDTEVRVLLGDDAVWIGARMWDSEPEVIEARLTRRDDFGGGGGGGGRGGGGGGRGGSATYDMFGVMFDPNLDGLTGYAFAVSAANVQSDTYLYEDDQQDGAWDAVWSSAVSIDDRGWVAEIRIPLSQLRYEASEDPQAWGINFFRRRVASNEETWYALVSRLRRGLVSQMGRIDNVVLREPAQRFEVVPYLVSSLHRGPAESGDPFFDGTAANGRVGVDLSYGLGAAFTLDATINPDFGQVEADPAVINLSAFETFFEERRPFFVEDARIFDFSLSGGRNQLFYSRRVGRSPNGSAPSDTEFSDVPENATILGAAKLAGRTESGLSVGALAAVTGAEHGRAAFADGSRGDFLVEPRTEFGAASIAKDFNGGASQVGLLGTAMRRDLPGSGSFDWLPSSAFSGGVRFNHQWNNRDWAIFGYVSGSHVRGSPEAITRVQRSSVHYFQRPDATRFSVDSTATSISGVDWRLTLAKQNGEHWTWSVWAAEVTKGFEVNDLGFSTRTEVLDGGAALTYQEIQPGRLLRNYNLSVRTFHNWSHEALDDTWSTRSWNDAHTNGNYSFNAFGQFLNYWGVGTGLSYQPRRMDRRTTRGGPMMVSPPSVNWNLNLFSDRRKVVSFGAFLGIRDDKLGVGGGSNFGAQVRFQPSDNLAMSVNPRYELSRSGDQYVTATGVLPYGPTYGSRYLFADLEQRTFSMETRVDWTFSPTLSLQLYAQPLLSSGDYVTYKQLAAAETFDFLDLGPSDPSGTQSVDYDGDGTADHTFSDRDFNVR
ncbi:MAG TPA: DUF5916 domain-containing protein, partial [Longimicrobiales bacterium]|nr:DUF5916 domain-containing protein [Longimicrobiales bacterium]